MTAAYDFRQPEILVPKYFFANGVSHNRAILLFYVLGKEKASIPRRDKKLGGLHVVFELLLQERIMLSFKTDSRSRAVTRIGCYLIIITKQLLFYIINQLFV